MITSRSAFGLLLAAGFFMSGSFFLTPTTAADTQTRGTSRQSDGTHSASHRPAANDQATSPSLASMLSQAATGQWDDGSTQLEEPPLNGTAVQPVGGHVAHGPGCGPICDCDQHELGCGVDAIYADDPSCDWEIGCGLEGAIETVHPGSLWNGGDCDCDQCRSIGDPVCGMDTFGDCACDACSGGHADHIPLCVPILRVDWHSFDFFWGHQGFTGPLNYVSISDANPNVRSGNGSFGFYQGFNKGSSLKRWLRCNLSSQMGVRATQSNYSGSGFTRDRRYQVFVTAGVFRRVDYGLQYGLVLDYLNQDWYFQGDALQMRGELSWRCESRETLGFQFMAGVRTDTSNTFVKDGSGDTIRSTIRMEPTDQYRFFYRRPIVCNGQFSAFAGWTDQSDGLLGSSLNLHLSPRLLLATDATYLIPDEGRSSGGNEQESWNVAVGFVFRPGGSRAFHRYNMPMFDVADNGSFLIDRR